MPKKVLMCVFPFLEKKSLEIKKRLLNSIERESQSCTLKILFKFSRKASRTYGNFTFEKQTH